MHKHEHSGHRGPDDLEQRILLDLLGDRVFRPSVMNDEDHHEHRDQDQQSHREGKEEDEDAIDDLAREPGATRKHGSVPSLPSYRVNRSENVKAMKTTNVRRTDANMSFRSTPSWRRCMK